MGARCTEEPRRCNSERVHREVHRRCGAVQSAPECAQGKVERCALQGCSRVQGAPWSNRGVTRSGVHREEPKFTTGLQNTKFTVKIHKMTSTTIPASLNISLHIKILLLNKMKNYATSVRFDLITSRTRDEPLTTILQRFLTLTMTFKNVGRLAELWA